MKVTEVAERIRQAKPLLGALLVPHPGASSGSSRAPEERVRSLAAEIADRFDLKPAECVQAWADALLEPDDAPKEDHP